MKLQPAQKRLLSAYAEHPDGVWVPRNYNFNGLTYASVAAVRLMEAKDGNRRWRITAVGRIALEKGEFQK